MGISPLSNVEAHVALCISCRFTSLISAAALLETTRAKPNFKGIFHVPDQMLLANKAGAVVILKNRVIVFVYQTWRYMLTFEKKSQNKCETGLRSDVTKIFRVHPKLQGPPPATFLGLNIHKRYCLLSVLDRMARLSGFTCPSLPSTRKALQAPLWVRGRRG
jgi:hypothetical protein